MTTLSEMIPVMLLKTEQAKLNWELLGTSSFLTRIGSAVLEIGRRNDGIAFLNLRNADSVVVESVNYNSLPGGLDEKLNVLLDAARRRAYGTDQLLGSLKDQLDKL